MIETVLWFINVAIFVRAIKKIKNVADNLLNNKQKVDFKLVSLAKLVITMFIFCIGTLPIVILEFKEIFYGPLFSATTLLLVLIVGTG